MKSYIDVNVQLHLDSDTEVEIYFILKSGRQPQGILVGQTDDVVFITNDYWDTTIDKNEIAAMNTSKPSNKKRTE